MAAGGGRCWGNTLGRPPQVPHAVGNARYFGHRLDRYWLVEPEEIIDVGAQIVAIVKSFGPGSPIDRQADRLPQSSVKKRGGAGPLDDLPHKAELSKALVYLAACRSGGQALPCANQADRAFRRANELRGTESEAEFEKAEADNEMAVAEVGMAEAKLEQAKIAAKQAEINLHYTTITRPSTAS